ncbi:globin domain-containing protein [Actinomadura rugatobispora]|uniref:nitric oxide dioxygenase n=1 Tax=Actinomadura rugatobispora TaxID=1994 RepID=A0ABW0ZYT7_9ACTN|nr:FAD-binding oxidoreductase [Actinomadura rugatobispora]
MSWEPHIIKESFTWLEPVADDAAGYFYGRLFAAEPRLRTLFPPAMDVQRRRLFHALAAMVWSADSPGALAETLGRLGRGHRRYGVLPEHYPAVGTALIATLRKFGGTVWTPEAEAAWTAAYRSAAEIMIAAAERDAERSPAWWVAEVTGHDRRSGDLAVLALRPARPLPFEPGQYVPVQVSRWPRIWRPYSLAGAPRPDGTLRLHVRAVPGGWVSGALVRHTRPGDSVLLGPALGGMTLDPGSRRDLLLVAGGTGLAPLKAMAERVAVSSRDRGVHLVAAARTEGDLYDLPDLLALASAYPRLQITPMISDGPPVLDEVPGLDEREVYVAGPVEMVRSTVDALHRLDVPPARIHHDPLEAEFTSPRAPAGTPTSPRPPDRTTRSPVPPR